MAREWIERSSEPLERELRRLEAHLELEAETRSTIEESLRRERERVDAERERAQRLEAELAAARRGLWRRFFGFGE